jgi:hypothetical protein
VKFILLRRSLSELNNSRKADIPDGPPLRSALTDKEIKVSWFWNAFQQTEISENRKRGSEAQIDAKVALRSINELEEKVDRLSLLCHALFEELERTTGFSEAQLKEKMTQIDLRDGRSDGKYDPVLGSDCPDCGRKVKKTRSNCFWCGASLGAFG